MKNIAQNLWWLLLLLPMTTQAQDAFTGSWKLEIPDGSGNLIPIKVVMSDDGKYTADVGMDGSVEIEGRRQLEGADEVILWDTGGTFACPSDVKGRYKYKLEGDMLILTVVSDACEGRTGPDGKTVFQRIK